MLLGVRFESRLGQHAQPEGSADNDRSRTRGFRHPYTEVTEHVALNFIRHTIATSRRSDVSEGKGSGQL